jgi:hypothetical protein
MTYFGFRKNKVVPGRICDHHESAVFSTEVVCSPERVFARRMGAKENWVSYSGAGYKVDSMSAMEISTC